MTVNNLISDLELKLVTLRQDYAGLSLRQKVLRLVDILKTNRKLNVGIVKSSGCNANAARDRLKLYFEAHVGIILDAIELEVVGSISEYARRIRELRVQDGYKILTGNSNDPAMGVALKATQYLLIDAIPDKTAARRWHIANRIRKESGGARDRILNYLQANLGEVVTSEEIFYVAQVSEFGRRTRELRTEEGFAVATRFTGRPDLKPGEYVLESIDRVAEPHDRHIPEAVQKAVYERDVNTCRNCGWSRDQWTRQHPRFLELHHVEHHVAGGKNLAENLMTLCNKCHDDVHAGRIDVTLLVD